MNDACLGFLVGSINWWIFRFTLVRMMRSAGVERPKRGPSRLLSALALGRYWLVGITALLLVTRGGVSPRPFGLGLLVATVLFLGLQCLSSMWALKMEKKI